MKKYYYLEFVTLKWEKNLLGANRLVLEPERQFLEYVAAYMF